MFRDFLVLYCRMLRVSTNHKFSLSAVSWRWLLVVGRSKIWNFAGAVNLLAFPEVVCKGGLPLLELLPLLPAAEAEGWEVCVWGLTFTDWDLCCGHGGGFISPKLSFLGGLVFDLTSCKRGIFCFAASILRYYFFLCSHCLSHDEWVPLHNGHFCALSWGHSEVLCGPEQAPHFVVFWQWTETWPYS